MTTSMPLVLETWTLLNLNIHGKCRGFVEDTHLPPPPLLPSSNILVSVDCFLLPLFSVACVHHPASVARFEFVI